jgi:arylsulfatase
VPIQGKVGEFLSTFKAYPPRAKAASFTVDQILQQLQDA